VADLLKIVIDRCESDVGNLVDIFEAVEDIFSETLGSDTLFVACPLILELVDHALDECHVDIALVDGLSNALLDLGSVVHFLYPGGFSHGEVDELHALEGGEPSSTLLTLSTTPNGSIIFCHTGVDHFCVEVFTFWAAHVPSLVQSSHLTKKISVLD
jgi:hypothetical protein